jgi:hypothetical protein
MQVNFKILMRDVMVRCCFSAALAWRSTKIAIDIPA